MDMSHHAHHGAPGPGAPSHLNRLALSATLHCLVGCGTGEVLGLLIGSALGWSVSATIALAVGLAFLFGYAFTMRPMVASGMGLRAAMRLALAADTASITIMEIIDNGLMLVIPGAMDAGPSTMLYWSSLVAALALAAVAAFPVNRWLIARGRGHAVVHTHHHG